MTLQSSATLPRTPHGNAVPVMNDPVTGNDFAYGLSWQAAPSRRRVTLSRGQRLRLEFRGISADIIVTRDHPYTFVSALQILWLAAFSGEPEALMAQPTDFWIIVERVEQSQSDTACYWIALARGGVPCERVEQIADTKGALGDVLSTLVDLFAPTLVLTRPELAEDITALMGKGPEGDGAAPNIIPFVPKWTATPLRFRKVLQLTPAVALGGGLMTSLLAAGAIAMPYIKEAMKDPPPPPVMAHMALSEGAMADECYKMFDKSSWPDLYGWDVSLIKCGATGLDEEFSIIPNASGYDGAAAARLVPLKGFETSMLRTIAVKNSLTDWPGVYKMSMDENSEASDALILVVPFRLPRIEVPTALLGIDGVSLRRYLQRTLPKNFRIEGEAEACCTIDTPTKAARRVTDAIQANPSLRVVYMDAIDGETRIRVDVRLSNSIEKDVK